MADTWEVPQALDGERLDRALALVTGLSRRLVNALLDDGRVRVAGRPSALRSRRVRIGEQITIEGGLPADSDQALVADPAVGVPVVWHDDSVIVVDKPAGLVVHPGASNHSGTLVHGLLARFPDLAGFEGDRPGIVHRLDKGTSGLMLVARTEEAKSSLTDQLATRRMARESLTLVAGTLESDSGLIDAPLGRSDRDPTRIRVQAGGREARTHYSVEARYQSTTVLRCRLETGRTHQIRVHLASIGHPVVGDDRYGKGGASVAGRLFLHATDLAFDHPAGGERKHFTSPLPEELAEALTRLS